MSATNTIRVGDPVVIDGHAVRGTVVAVDGAADTVTAEVWPLRSGSAISAEATFPVDAVRLVTANPDDDPYIDFEV